MNQDLLSLATTGFAVAFMHSAIPVHWLPIVLSARAQRWGVTKTASVTVFVSCGHALLTILLGALIVLAGNAVGKRMGDTLPLIEVTLLVAIAFFYMFRQWNHKGHVHLFSGHHNHAHCTHEEPSRGDSTALTPSLQEELTALSHLSAPRPASDMVAIASLFALMTFSPCESFLPIYLAGIPHGWAGFIVLSLVLTAAAMAAFMFFTTLTLLGVGRFQMKFLGKYENGFVGIIFLILGITKLAHLHHHHG